MVRAPTVRSVSETTRVTGKAHEGGQRNEWAVLQEAAQLLYRTLRQDLGRRAFRLEPLQPLALRRLEGARIPRLVRRVLRRLPHIALAALAAFAFLLSATGWSGSPAAGAAAGLPLVLAMFRPVGAFWLSLLLVAVGAVLGPMNWYEAWPWSPGAFLSHIAVMAFVALRARPSAAVWMWTITTAYGAVAASTTDRWTNNSEDMAVVSGIVLLIAVALRGWRTAHRESEAKDVVTAHERSQRTLLQERTTIARELHDVVAHHMSVVAIQAEAAPYRVENPPPELTAAFATIRENAVAALAELRRVLGVVRAEAYEPNAAPDAPQPTLADLDRLLENVREAGLTVDKVVTGAVRELPPGVELSAYRIIQEALSNTLRHAPGAPARVEIAYVFHGLGLRVVNGPPAAESEPSPGAGHGLTGMRERVTMLEGELATGATGDGGYQVEVFLPVREVTE
ncbi:histidine kinase [Streptomyces sp. NPDC051940]|uniref:sensor histidine kinase n=1 Tax=Streptomyces sp. NPDC051940 TaxID=3155675 RepID=UPI003429E1EA